MKGRRGGGLLGQGEKQLAGEEFRASASSSSSPSFHRRTLEKRGLGWSGGTLCCVRLRSGESLGGKE